MEWRLGRLAVARGGWRYEGERQRTWPRSDAKPIGRENRVTLMVEP